MELNEEDKLFIIDNIEWVKNYLDATLKNKMPQVYLQRCLDILEAK